MNPIRVHLGPMPELLRTIISDLLGPEQDLVLVGRSGPGQDALRNARDENADVLITQDRVPGEDSCLDAILSAQPLGIFTLSADGHEAAAVDLVRRPIALDRDRSSTLADAIRQTAENLNSHPPARVRQ